MASILGLPAPPPNREWLMSSFLRSPSKVNKATKKLSFSRNSENDPTILAFSRHCMVKAATCRDESQCLKVIYHPLYSMNKFVTKKSKLPQDGTQVFPYMG